MLKSIMQERWSPQYVNAYINMALKLEAENAVIAQMNKLGIQTKIWSVMQF
jgi:hypothetical protein